MVKPLISYPFLKISCWDHARPIVPLMDYHKVLALIALVCTDSSILIGVDRGLLRNGLLRHLLATALHR